MTQIVQDVRVVPDKDAARPAAMNEQVRENPDRKNNRGIQRRTGLLERNSTAYVKALGLEGAARVFTHELSESILLAPGQLLITNPQAKRLPEPVNFFIAQLYQPSLLINSGFAPLARRDGIQRPISKQKSDASYIPANLVIFGRGILVNLMPPPSNSPS